jgi:hypothetical protein
LSRRCRHRTERLFGLEMPRQSSVKPAAASLKPAGEPSPWGQLRLSQHSSTSSNTDNTRTLRNRDISGRG